MRHVNERLELKSSAEIKSCVRFSVAWGAEGMISYFVLN